MTPRPSTGVRERIVKAAQETIHERGYHGSSVDDILARAGATKGGMYHHFPDKDALGVAVVNERLREMVEARWGGTAWHEDPLTFLGSALTGMNPEHLVLGCPVNSFAQEVSAHQDRIRAELAEVFDRWMALIADGLRAGVEAGTVRSDVDADAVAGYYLAVWEGAVALAKAKRAGPSFVQRVVAPLGEYLESLRA